jgi:ubiquinone/menaquinone biosynthesis C-methylase UbiE
MKRDIKEAMVKITVEEKYANPMVVDFWLTLARQGLQQAEQEMVNRYLPPDGHLLDVGCGAGRALLALTAQGYRVIGIDLSLPMLRAGHRLAPDTSFGGANLLRLPFADNTFSAALMFFGALQHTPGQAGRREAFAALARVVAPGGRLVLGLDNLSPALSLYGYWAAQKVTGRRTIAAPAQNATNADQALWQRRAHPVVWHLRGLLRSLRWRTWPGLVDIYRSLVLHSDGAQPGDIDVAQFSQPATPGNVYYHVYRPEIVIADALTAGWHLMGWHCGSELGEGTEYPVWARRLDKQLFFAFEHSSTTR